MSKHNRQLNLDEAAFHPRKLRRTQISVMKSSNNKSTARNESALSRNANNYASYNLFDSTSSIFSLKSQNLSAQTPTTDLKLLNLHKKMSQVEIDYTKQMTRVVQKDELVGGVNMIEKFIREKCNNNKKGANSVHQPVSRMPSATSEYQSALSYDYSRLNSPLTRNTSAASLLSKRRSFNAGNQSQTSSVSNILKDTPTTQSNGSSTAAAAVTILRRELLNNTNSLMGSSAESLVSVNMNNSSGELRRSDSAVIKEILDRNSVLSMVSSKENASFYKASVLNRRVQQAHSAPTNLQNSNKSKLLSSLSSINGFDPIADRKKARSHNENRHVHIHEPAKEIKKEEKIEEKEKKEEKEEKEQREQKEDEAESVLDEASEAEFQEKIMNDTFEINKSNIQETLQMIQSKLKAINEEEINAKSSMFKHLLKKNDSVELKDGEKSQIEFDREKNSKSITRKRNLIVTKSMNVDKWIEVHKRQNTNRAISLLQKNVIKTKKQREEMSKLKKNIEEVKLNNLNDETTNADPNKSRSRRQLVEITVLDKVQSRLKLQLIEKLKILRQMETQNEFNIIVRRIKDFLDDMEGFKNADNNIINDYFLNYSNNKMQSSIYNNLSGFGSSTDISKYNPIKLYELALV